MAKVKFNTAEFIQGIREPNSGTLNFLKFSKNGKVELSDNGVMVKRPNQYAKKMGSKY